MTCPHYPNRTRYPTRRKALRAIAKRAGARHQPGLHLCTFHCKACGGYHLGKKRGQ